MNLEKVLDELMKKNEYISLDLIYPYLNDEKISKEDKSKFLSSIYSYNNRIIKNIDKSIKKLKSAYSSTYEVPNITLSFETNTIKSLSTENNDNIAYNKNVSNYISLINEFKSYDDFCMLYELIDDDFDNTINKIISHYILEIVNLKNFEYEDDTLDFKEDLIKNKNIINNLNLLKNNYNKSVNNNHILYLKGSTVNFIDDLEKIPTDFYQSISNAFYSIIDGTFKNRKRIGKAIDGFYCPLLQVRDNDIRIYYIKISDNLYLVSDVIVKKVSTSHDYSKYIRKISKDLSYYKDQITKELEDNYEEFIKENDEITDNIINTLQKKKVLK